MEPKMEFTQQELAQQAEEMAARFASAGQHESAAWCLTFANALDSNFDDE